MCTSTALPTYFVLRYCQPSPIPKALFKNVDSIPHSLPPFQPLNTLFADEPNFTNDAPFTGLRFDSNASAFTIYGNAISLSGNSTINNSSNNETINIPLDGIGGVTQAGTGTLTLTVNNSYFGGTTISAGTVAISNSGALGRSALNYSGNGTLSILTPLTLSNGVSVNNGITATINNNGFNLTNAGVIYGSGGVNFIGTGTFTFSQMNTYSGPTSLNGTTVAFSTNNPLGTGTVTFAASSTLSNAGSYSMVPNVLLITSGVTATFNPGTSQQTLGLDYGKGELLFSGAITGSGAVSIVSTGNYVTFDGDTNTYSGGTTLNGGVVQFLTSAPFGSGSVTVAGSCILKVLANQSITNPIVINSGVVLNLSNEVASYVPTYAGIISGPGSLVSSGNPGAANYMTASNTYNGSTIVSSGTLLLETDASIYGSTNINLGTQGSQGILDISSQQFYSIGTNQTLSGYGLLHGPAVLLNVNGHITPGSMDGSTRGLVTINGNITLGSNSATTLTLNNAGVAGTDYDSVNVSGFLNYGGELDLIVNTPSEGTFDLFSAGSLNENFTNLKLFGSWNTGSFTQGAGGNWTYTDPNNTYNFDFTPSSGLLQVMSVPEPSSCALLGLGALALGMAYMRKSRFQATFFQSQHRFGKE